MKRVQVLSSSVVRSVGYEPRTGTLEVEFVSSEVYHYLDVDPADVDALLAAESKGRYLNTHIKPRYESVYVGTA